MIKQLSTIQGEKLIQDKKQEINKLANIYSIKKLSASVRKYV